MTIRAPRNPNTNPPHVPSYVNPNVNLKPKFDWSNWDELTVQVRGLKLNETTYNLWKNFRTQGEIAFIDIRETNGIRDGSARIRYSPPPHTPFWDECEVRGKYPVRAVDDSLYDVSVSFNPQTSRPFLVQSPIKRHIWYEPQMKMYADRLHFGIMVDHESMMPLRTLEPSEAFDLCFRVNLQKRRIVTNFKVKFLDDGSTSHLPGYKPNEFNRVNQYRFEIPFGQLKAIQRVELNQGAFGLLISLDNPPQFYRKRMDQKVCHADEGLQWNEMDTWYRQTDLVYDPYPLQRAVVTLHKERPFIDLGKPPFSLSHSITCRFTHAL